MRNTFLFAAAAGLIASTPIVQAETYTFASGSYDWGVTAPDPLLNPHVLELVTPADKTWDTKGMTNEGGTVSWKDGTLILKNGAPILNQKLWDAKADNLMRSDPSGTSTFTNEGVFRKSGGTGVTEIRTSRSSNGGLTFINSGSIDAQTGTIRISGTGDNVFKAGSSFTGNGTVIVESHSNTRFEGSFSASNLVLTGGGYFNGYDALLHGQATLDATDSPVFLVGGWTVGSGSTLNLAGVKEKIYGQSSTLVNHGTVNWQAGDFELYTGGKVENRGVWDAKGNDAINLRSTSGTHTFTNEGVFRKSGGTGVTEIATSSGLTFINSGNIDAQTGTIRISGTGDNVFKAGSSFTGNGTVIVESHSNTRFEGSFSASNLVLTGGGYFNGYDALLHGQATLDATDSPVFLVGGWTVGSGSTLNLAGERKKVYGQSSTLVNRGTVNWQAGDFELYTSGKVDNRGVWDAQADGTLIAGSGDGIRFTNDGTFRKSAGTGTTTISVPFDNYGIINVLSGTIALPKDFSNYGTLAGTGAYAVSGTLHNNGVIAPGDLGEIGVLTLLGDYMQSADGSLAIQLASTSLSDLFDVRGSTILDGLLDLTCILQCEIAANDRFLLLTSLGNLSGAFSDISTSGFGAGFDFSVIYDYGRHEVWLSVAAAGTGPVDPPPGGNVPEPASGLLLTTGLALAGFVMRKRGTA